VRFVRIFAGVYCRGATNRSGAAKIMHYRYSVISQISSDVWPQVMYITMKALSGFLVNLVIERQTILRVYDVRKFQRPPMSDSFCSCRW